MENEIIMLKEKFARDEDEIRILIEQDLSREKVVEQSQEELTGLRKAEN
jgi:hypothetical protein